MPRRTQLRDRLTPPPAKGREALYDAGTPSTVTSTVDRRPTTTVDRLPSPVQEALITLPGWEDSHKRVTFYCPKDLLDAVEEAMRRSDRSKTQVIVDAIRKDLER